MVQLAVTVFVVLLPEESTTCAVNEKVPGCVGVPVMAPVEVFSVSPAGRLPEMMEYVYGGTPPEAIRAELYGTPTCPVLLAHFSASGDGRALNASSTPTSAPGLRVKVATSVMENGVAEGPGPLSLRLMLVVPLPVTVRGGPTGILVPNSALVLSV